MSDEEQVHESDAWRDNTRRSGPGGTAATGKQSEGGGDGYEEGRTHTGWGPVDGELADEAVAVHGRHRHIEQDAWRDDSRQSGPGGTASSGKQSEGGGAGYEKGRTHTGWAPVDGELAEGEAAHRSHSAHED